MPLPLNISCFSKIQTDWYRLTRVVPDKGPLNGCVCVCTWVSWQLYVPRVRRAGTWDRPSVVPGWAQTSSRRHLVTPTWTVAQWPRPSAPPGSAGWRHRRSPTTSLWRHRWRRRRGWRSGRRCGRVPAWTRPRPPAQCPSHIQTTHNQTLRPPTVNHPHTADRPHTPTHV